MWARISRYQFPPDESDHAVERFELAVDAISAQPGLERADIFVNRASGAGITVTVWESRDALKASAEAADRLRDEIALDLSGWIQGIEEYELVLSRTF